MGYIADTVKKIRDTMSETADERKKHINKTVDDAVDGKDPKPLSKAKPAAKRKVAKKKVSTQISNFT